LPSPDREHTANIGGGQAVFRRRDAAGYGAVAARDFRSKLIAFTPGDVQVFLC